MKPRITGSTPYSFFSAAWQDLEDQAISASPPPSGSSGPVMTTLDTYVWGRANVDELVARDDASGNRLYAQQDANGNVTALVGNVSGTWQVVQRFTYTPYGVMTVLSPSWGTTTDAYNWVYGYQGGRYDPITGLYNFRRRDYSPTLGRWMQNDPAGYVNGANLYEANLGAPISHVDPYGLDASDGSGSAGGTGSGGTNDGSSGSTTNGGSGSSSFNNDPWAPPCQCGCGNAHCGSDCRSVSQPGRPIGPIDGGPVNTTQPTTEPSPTTQPTTEPSSSTGGPIGGYPPTQPVNPPPIPKLSKPKPPTTKPTQPKPPHPKPPEVPPQPRPPVPPQPRPPVPPRPPRGHGH